MITDRLLEEAEKLFPNKDLNAIQTVGYRELFQYFKNDFTLNLAIEEIKKNTQRFSKRQMTWFKHLENVKWFDFVTKYNKIINYINLTL